jgi:hypothetical protein
MRRTALCLLLALASAGVAAHASKLSSPGDSGACSTHGSRQAEDRADDRDTAPALPPASKAKPAPRAGGGGGSDGDASGRVPSVRWHRFLPGMFR